MAPGPTPTFTMSAPAATRSATPDAVTTFPATTGTDGARPRTARSADSIFSWWPCAVSTTRMSTPASSSSFALAATSPFTPTAAPTRSRPAASVAGEYSVARSAPVRVRIPVHSPDGATTGASRCRPSCSRPNARSGGVPAGSVNGVGGHHGAELGEPVRPRAVRLGDDADRHAGAVDHHHRAVRPLGQQRERLADGVRRAERDRRVDDEVAGLDPLHHVGDHVGGDVLRQDRDAAAPRDRLRHAAAGNGGHVGRHDRDGGAAAVPRGQVDVEPRPDRRPPGHHEHIAIGQVGGRLDIVKETHVLNSYRRPGL